MAQPALRRVLFLPAVPEQADVDAGQFEGQRAGGQLRCESGGRHEAAWQHRQQVGLVSDAPRGEELLTVIITRQQLIESLRSTALSRPETPAADLRAMAEQESVTTAGEPRWRWTYEALFR
jgi:hypothetical protein